jgi:hypothetical protein
MSARCIGADIYEVQGQHRAKGKHLTNLTIIKLRYGIHLV